MENLTGGTPPVRYLPCVVPCKLYFISDEKYKTLTVGIQSLAGMYYTEWGPIGAGMVVATFPVLLIYILLSRQVQNAILAGAVKG